MSDISTFSDKLFEETLKQRNKVIGIDTTLNEIEEFLKENALIDLLVRSIHWFNNLSFDKFLSELDLEKLQLDKIDENTNSTALQLASFLCLPKTTLKLVELNPEQIGRLSKNEYSPLSTAILNCFIEKEMHNVVLRMLDFPEYCNLKSIHNFNRDIKCYVWQYVCNKGIEFIIRKMVDKCLPHFNFIETTNNSNPLIDLVNHEIEDIVVDIINKYRDRCHLEKVYNNKTILIVALLKNCKQVVLEILTNYDDCNFQYINPSGISAFELLCAYGYQGVVFDILENNRNLYHTKFIHSKAKTPFELALFQKNWDLAATLVAYKYVNIEELRNTRVNGIPVKQYLIIQNETDLLKFFLYVENKFNSQKEQQEKVNISHEGWQKIKELGLETLVKDVIKDPITFTQKAQNGEISIPKIISKSDSIDAKLKIKPKIEKTIIPDIIMAPKKRGRPRKVKEPIT